MSTKDLHQHAQINTSPHDVFEVLMDEKKHAKLTGSPAKISREVGGSFSTFDGYATGKNIAIEKDKKIVQTWHASDWPKDSDSEIIFELQQTKDGNTLIHFSHKNVPEAFAESIADGWQTYYWTPLQKMFQA